MTIRPDYLSPIDNYLEGNDLKDPRLLQMDMNSVSNIVADKRIDERYIQLCNKYPFLNVSPKLNQSHFYVSIAANPSTWTVPDGTLLLRMLSLSDCYASFYNACPQTLLLNREAGGIMLPQKTLSPLYYIEGVRQISFYSSLNTLVFIEYGA